MNEPIEIEINLDDRNLLLKELNLPPAIQQTVRFGWGKERSRYISLDMAAWMQVLEELLKAHVSARAGGRKERLRDLAEYLSYCINDSQQLDTDDLREHQAFYGALDADAIDASAGAGPPPGPLESLHPELRNEIDALLQANPARSLEEVETTLRNAKQLFLQKPLDVLGGVSLVEAGSLLVFEMNEEMSPLHLSDALSPDAVLQLPLLRSTRVLLELAQASGGIKIRSDETLAKQSRREIIDSFRAFLPPGEVIEEFETEALGAMAEMYFSTLMELNLVEPKRGRAFATAEGKRLAQEDTAPELFRRLFAYLMASVGEDEDLDFVSADEELEMEDEPQDFMDADDAFMDEVEISCVQALPYMLFRLSQVEEWLTRQDLTRRLLSPALAKVYADAMDAAESEVFACLMIPLLQFGLLETEQTKASTQFEEFRFRKTALFDQFISFDWGRVRKEEILESRDAQAYVCELLL